MEKSRVIIHTLPRLPGRLIIVGDIHGCLEEFENLLKEVEFQVGVDTLIHVGDLVNKGRDSKGVVLKCMELNAVGVVGNHDDTLLECYDANLKVPYTKEQLRDPVKRLARYIGSKCAAYLRGLPHVLRIPQYNLIIVHAGINPCIGLQDQIPMDLVTMRRVMADGHAVAKGSIDGTMWAKVWSGPETIVFGHDAKTGLQEESFALGLDTGCVYGGRLTAVVYPGRKLVSVPGAPMQARAKPGQEDQPLSIATSFSPSYVPDDKLMTPSMVRGRPPSLHAMTPPAQVSVSPGARRTSQSPMPVFPPEPMTAGTRPSESFPQTPSAPHPPKERADLEKLLHETRLHALKVVTATKDVDAFLSLVHHPTFEDAWNALLYESSVPFEFWKDVAWFLARGLAPAAGDQRKQAHLLHYLQDVLMERPDVSDTLCFLLRAQLQDDHAKGRIVAEKPYKALMLVLRP